MAHAVQDHLRHGFLPNVRLQRGFIIDRVGQALQGAAIVAGAGLDEKWFRRAGGQNGKLACAILVRQALALRGGLLPCIGGGQAALIHEIKGRSGEIARRDLGIAKTAVRRIHQRVIIRRHLREAGHEREHRKCDQNDDQFRRPDKMRTQRTRRQRAQYIAQPNRFHHSSKKPTPLNDRIFRNITGCYTPCITAGRGRPRDLILRGGASKTTRSSFQPVVMTGPRHSFRCD